MGPKRAHYHHNMRRKLESKNLKEGRPRRPAHITGGMVAWWHGTNMQVRKRVVLVRLARERAQRMPAWLFRIMHDFQAYCPNTSIEHRVDVSMRCKPYGDSRTVLVRAVQEGPDWV